MKSIARHPQPAAALREVLERDVRAAIDRLQARGGTDVHAVRKDVKHARAIVRLFLYGLSDTHYQRLNRGLRDAARPLASTRDTQVLLATIERLERKHGIKSLRRWHEMLTREQRKSRRESSTGRQAALARGQLETVAQHIAKISDTAADWPAIIGAIGQTYRRARRAARRARGEPSSDHLHEWRKHVKYLWHQVQILAPPAARPLARMARDLHRLADHLGDHHDLALLEGRAEENEAIAEEDREDFKALLDQRRARLERKAHELGERLFSGKRKRFVRKLEAAIDLG